MIWWEIAQSSLATQQGFVNVKDSVQKSFRRAEFWHCGCNAAVIVGTLANAIAIRDDGDKTRALSSSNDRDNLNRKLIVSENTITELRLNARRRQTRRT